VKTPRTALRRNGIRWSWTSTPPWSPRTEKENAAPTFKRGFGFHPLCAFVDHRRNSAGTGTGGGTGEALAIRLRPGNAGSNTATDHIAVTTDALTALPGVNPSRPGRTILIRADGGGGTKEFLAWLTRRGLSYSIGFTLPATMNTLYRLVPEQHWQAAVNADGDVRKGAGVVDLTDILRFHGHLDGWPQQMRVIVRRERPHPGAQLRFDDVDGYRLTAFATNTVRTKGPQLADLELRHRRRARCEDRIRIAKDTGLRNLPLKGFDQNRIWCALVMLATDLTAWTQLLAVTAQGEVGAVLEVARVRAPGDEIDLGLSVRLGRACERVGLGEVGAGCTHGRARGIDCRIRGVPRVDLHAPLVGISVEESHGIRI